MSHIIDTKRAPSAIGPYVQGINTGKLIFTSGQIPVNPQNGEIPDDVVKQTRLSLENVKAIVQAAGLEVSHIIKTTVFVSDMNDFGVINQAYKEFFDENEAGYPTRSCVQVARLPKDVKIEIEAIAATPDC